MTVAEAILEWKSKPRRMGCMSASRWFCARVKGFRISSVDRYTKTGDLYGHTVAFDGQVVVDLTPQFDLPDSYDPAVDGKLKHKN